MRQQRGSALVATLVFMVVIGAMTAAVSVLSVSTHQSAQRSRDLRKAARAADSALGFYVLQLEIDGDYFLNQPAPHAPLPVGDTTFRLLSVVPGAGPDDWLVDVETTSDAVAYRVHAHIVDEEIEVPEGLWLAGTGDPSDDILTMNGASRLASYDPAVGTGTLNDDANVMANGSIALSGTALIRGDATASGWINSVGPSGVTGSETEVADEFPLEPFDDVIDPIAAASVASNDNGTLSGVFGPRWSPIAGPQNYGDLTLNGGSYTLTAGTYRIRDLTVTNGANLVLDTSGGKITIVCAGSCEVSSGSSVLIDSGTTSNGLVTVLEDGVGFEVDGGSTFGREVNEPEAAGYSQLLSTGGSGDLVSQGNSTVYARVAAPTRELFVGGASTWLGSAIVRTARLIGSGPKFFIDESDLGSVIGSTGEYEVEARWRGTVAP